MAINYGQVIDRIEMPKYNKVFFITDLDGIYSLIEVNYVLNIENVILRCSDIEYIEFKLKEELKKWMIDNSVLTISTLIWVK